MPSKTNIEYGDYVSNPIKFQLRKDTGLRRVGRVGQACVKVGPECKHCWAEGMNKRFWTGLGFTQENMEKVEPFLDEAEMAKLANSKTISGKQVLVEFNSDLFGEWVEENWLDRLFMLMAHRLDVTFVLLTKRAERLAKFIDRISHQGPDDMHAEVLWMVMKKQPLPNVWLGVTIGTHGAAIERMPYITALGLAGWRTWISAEPLLEFVNLAAATPPDEAAWDKVNAENDDDEPEEFVEECEAECDWVNCGNELVANPEHREWVRARRIRAGFLTFQRAIDLVVAGGESGIGARPTDPDNVRWLRDQCVQAGVHFYFKQWGEWGPDCGQAGDLSNYQMHVFKRLARQDELVFRFGKALAGHELDGAVWRGWPDFTTKEMP